MTDKSPIENPEVASEFMDEPDVIDTLIRLQEELVKMQHWIRSEQKRLAIVFEGRDSAGKSGAIKRFTQHLNPKHFRTVAMPKPSDVERGQWFFQRYIKELPNAGEIAFFDRSWYNRALVEPVLGFCREDQYLLFLKQAPLIEKMLIDDGIQIIKLWFSIDRKIQSKRLEARKQSILTSWKLSTIDQQAQGKWDAYTAHKDAMFEATHSEDSPWMIVQGNDKGQARIGAIRHVLTQVPYTDKNVDLLDSIDLPGIVSLHRPDRSN